tara:strand:+ start:42 stop:1262 length:1221 start_codon:yes stop_codon:yes gene_type:complete
MERLRSLIKEVLTVQPKKDCNCGCGGCSKKSPVITEGRIKKAISEGLTYHVENKIPLHKSVYRIGSEKHFELINEARKLWVRGLIDVSEDDQAILETHLGNFGMYEGEKVPLDMPMVNEEEKYLEDDNYEVDGTSVGDGKYEDEESEKQKTSEEKDRAREIMNNLFGYDFEFSFTYKSEGNKIVIDAEGYNDDGTLFDMKDVHKEKIIRTFRDKMPKAVAKPNMGGGITVFLKESLDEVDRYSGFNRNPEDPDSVPFEPKGSVAQFREELRALFGKFKGDLKNPEFIKGVAEIMVSWKSLLRSQLDEAKKKKKKKKKDPPIGKPKRGGSKAYYVYVRDPKTKRIKKVSFGSGGLKAKIRNADARKRFAARHNCKNKKDRTTAGYWSCNLPRYAEQLGLGSKMNTFW